LGLKGFVVVVVVVVFACSLDFILLNFRSANCFRLGWPMRADADFFCQPDERNEVSWIMFFILGI